MSNTPLTEFEPWPKIPRYGSLYVVITEKLDGTNAQLIVHPDGTLACASRTRFITPENDNFGFATWVAAHAAELRALPPGRYFGEWYGNGIQRQYGLDHKRLALFWSPACGVPDCVSVVPTLYAGPYLPGVVEETHAKLLAEGSVAVPGWMKPEGVVVQFKGAKDKAKITDLAPGKKVA